jgi:hypothetical protein
MSGITQPEQCFPTEQPLMYCRKTVTRLVSTKETALPLPPPLRTARISSPISGSSLSEHSCD